MVDLPAGVTQAVVSWVEPTATDNSGVVPSVTQTGQPMTEFNGGVTEVRYTFRDQAGNEAECAFTVTLNGNGGNKLMFNDALVLLCGDSCTILSCKLQ